MRVHRELWSRARPLFDELVQLESDERRARLDELQHTDPALHETLESLLVADGSAEDPLGEYSFGAPRGVDANITAAARDPLGIVGKQISHFRVDGFLASGGMGVVYRGEDLQLGRLVALKFPLPDQTVSDDVKTRFVREARAAASLDHPNLCPVYEIGETTHGVFLAMPLCPGETLKERLARDRVLSVDDAIAITRQVVLGLASAHAARIVHRDLKPGNIMLLPDGSVKVLDFGLAKVHDSSQSKSRMTVGTVAYMSPEQIRGDNVDGQADLWAIGVILHEMVTGAAPFRGDHELTLLHAILHEAPSLSSSARHKIPDPIGRVVSGLLQKNRAHRYRTAEELLTDLAAVENKEMPTHRIPLLHRLWQRKAARFGTLAAVSLVGFFSLVLVTSRLARSDNSFSLAPATSQTLVVLPFVNAEPASTNEYLVSGFTDGIVSRLSGARELAIAGLFSASALQREGLAPAAVGERLGAAHVVEGDLRVSGQVVLTSVKLRRVADNSIVWKHGFTFPLAALATLQVQIADSIAAVLRVNPKQSFSAQSQPGIDASAYNLYLRARYMWEQRTLKGMQDALADYGRAVELDPKFALASAAMAEAYVNMANFGHIPKEEALAIADRASARAVELDTSLAEAYAARGQVLSSQGKFAAAEVALKRAIDVRPSAPWAHHYYALLLTMLGRFHEAEAETRKTLSIDPLSVPATATLGILLAHEGRLDEARSQLNRSLQLSPNFIVALHYLGAIEAAQRNYPRARTLLEQAHAVAPEFPGVRGALAYTYFRTGDVAKARELLHAAESRFNGQGLNARGRARVDYGLGLAIVGETDSAFNTLHSAQWDIPTLFELRADPLLQDFRSKSRYGALLASSGLKP